MVPRARKSRRWSRTVWPQQPRWAAIRGADHPAADSRLICRPFGSWAIKATKASSLR